LRFTIVQLEVVGQRSFRARCSHARQAAVAQRSSLGGAPLHDGADQIDARVFAGHGPRAAVRDSWTPEGDANAIMLLGIPNPDGIR